MKQLQQSIKGIRIRRASIWMMVLSAVLFAVIFYNTTRATANIQTLTGDTDEYIFCQENALQITDASDYLTEQVRYYVLFGEKTYADNYFSEIHVAQRREQALETLSDNSAFQTALTYLQAAVDKSAQLTEQEIYAIKLVALAREEELSAYAQEVQDMAISHEDMALTAQEKQDKAQALVYSTDYDQDKAYITKNVNDFLTAVTRQIHEVQEQASAQLKRQTVIQRVGMLALYLAVQLTFALIILLVDRPLRGFIQSIQADKALDIRGSYECRYLAATYNKMYRANAKSKRVLRHRAEHDPLTKLLNRGAFDRQRQLLRDESAEPLAFLLVDVDRFKQINDTYGHEIGDKVLKKVSHLLQAGFRANDVVARLGGDEFGVIMMKMTPDNRAVIENKINSFNQLLQDVGQDDLPPVSLTVGAAFSPAGFPDELYSQADQALYQRKENGRCGCYFFL
jgi:diguanylate cyclase (GGDEF)-like protein